MTNRVLGALALTVAAAGVMLHERLGPPHTFWTIDNAGKALVLAQLDDGESGLPYAGQRVDPEFRYFPQPTTGSERYAVLHNERMLSQYESPFVWLSRPFFSWFGFAGLVLLPALGAGACVFLAGRLAHLRSGSATAAVVAATLTAFASPLLFYGSVFWEHTLVGALALGAMVRLERGQTRSAGILLGAACLFREEMLLLLLATLAVLAWRRSRVGDVLRAGIGGFAGVLALAVFHFIMTDSWSGLHVHVNRPIPFVNTLAALEGLIFGTGGVTLSWLVPAGLWVGALGLVLRSRITGGRSLSGGAVPADLPLPRAAAVSISVAALAIGALAGLAWWRFPAQPDAALALIRSNSLLVFAPWCLVAALLSLSATPARSSQARVKQPLPGEHHSLADAIVLLFVATFLVTVPERSITGIHPGPRMLLWPLLPVLAASLGTAAAAAPLRSWVLLPTVLVALAWNVRSLDLLAAKRTHTGQLIAAIESRPERIVATSLFWLPTELGSLWPSRQFHLLGTAADAADLRARLAAAGEKSMLVAEIPGTMPGPPVLSVRSERFPEFSVDLAVIPLETR